MTPDFPECVFERTASAPMTATAERDIIATNICTETPASAYESSIVASYRRSSAPDRLAFLFRRINASIMKVSVNGTASINPNNATQKLA